jgi:glycosyltransferase involved in cell wall biosynthesis/ubiquinone/menaquinone biosynthesis C-methylase UbiE
MDSYLYVAPNLGEVTVVAVEGLRATTERHRIPIAAGTLGVCLDPLGELDRRPELLGAVLAMERGWPGSSHLRFASRVLARGRRVWLYWPNEEAVEVLDRERIRGYWKLWAVVTAHRAMNRTPKQTEPAAPATNDDERALLERCTAALDELQVAESRVPLDLLFTPSRERPMPGVGAYLRTDYWVRITSGGSYGHTCYVAKELAAASERFVCFMAQRYMLLDDLGLHQVVMSPASEVSTEAALLAATWHYYPLLKIAFEALRPSYIYERLCLGNFTGALLSHELQIPYIVEYNGSEISMSRSFDGKGFQHEDVFTRAEDAAFRQATAITVVSEVVRDSLIARNVDPGKILVNPNGADPSVYAPPAHEQKAALRRELGFVNDQRVVGFSGTFGGWHGIDVLAEALPRIADRTDRARFLLIGDGSHKPKVDQSIADNRLESKVRSVGRVPQSEGARLLGACDIFVSPHNSHMVDSRFFGSPTKLFEYMAMGGGVVGSDLEQLGEVLSPALRASDLARRDLRVGVERAVLTTPGDVDEFVEAVVGLVERPDVSDALGRNARQAVLDRYSWQRHVENIWRFVHDGTRPAAFAAERVPAQRDFARVATGDAYKEEVQNQWNNNPVGPQYARVTRPHTLEWFQEIEAHRYGVYGPWMPEVMEFAGHAGEQVLEIGAGIGTDLSQFARHGAHVTDVDLSAGHLALARENFELRGLAGRFMHHDAETLPFDDASFDLVYSNGVLHHTPNTRRVVEEIRRVLRPGGRAIVMMYAEHSWHYWGRLVWELGLQEDMLKTHSIGEIMSRTVEITKNDARPLVKVYSARRLKNLFDGFEQRVVYKRQLMAVELPKRLTWMPVDLAGRLMGWNVVIKATKPRS